MFDGESYKWEVEMCLKLLRAALTGVAPDEELFASLTDEQWRKIYFASVAHGVATLVRDGWLMLDEEHFPPSQVRVTWAFDAQKTERKYAEKWKAFMSLHSFLKSNGIDYILLKGFTTAAFYPIPHHRDCGDIDIFSFQHDEIDELMMQKGITFEESGCDEKHTLFFWEKVPVENHILISYEKRLKSREKVTDKYTNILATTKRKQYICGPKGEQVEVGAVPASILFPYNAYHIVGHYTWQTVTMRHLTDWYVMRKHVSEEGTEYPESVALYVGVMDELTEHYFDGTSYKTGDLAKIEDGILSIVGRSKDLIIKGGMNISPALIEGVVSGIQGVEECSVFSVLNKLKEELIVLAYISATNDKELLEKTISSTVASKLGKNYLIDLFYRAKSIPKNINGKNDKKVLKENYIREFEA